jgi:outer membrane protein assembly factor BamB
VRAGGLLYTAVDAGQPLGILHAATGKRASTGHQIGTLNPGPVTVTGGRLYLTRSNAVRAYAP